MDTNKSNIKEIQEQEKRKQKPGLNAIRPDDYTENKFKEMAKNENMTQTALFEKIFYSFLKDQNSEKRNAVLDLDSEVNLISKDLSSIFNHFKSIVERAQETIISKEANKNQNEKNLLLNIDTLQEELREVKGINFDLAKSNELFEGLAKSMNEKSEKLAAENEGLKKEQDRLRKIIEEKDNSSKELEKQIALLEKNISKTETELSRVKEDLRISEEKRKRMEQANDSLNDTIGTLDTLKKAEITSMQDRLKRIENDKEKEIQLIEQRLRKEYEANNKMEVAELMLELAKEKERYNKLLLEHES